MKEALSFPVSSVERKNVFTKLRCRGDFHHNKTVDSTGEGETIVVRRPGIQDVASSESFTPCPKCLGYIKKKDLWKHDRACTVPKQQEVVANVRDVSNLVHSRMLLSEEKNELAQVIASMRDDEVTAVIRKDDLIKGVGSMLIDKHGSTQIPYVSQKMRELGRLLVILREQHENLEALSFFITPKRYTAHK